MQSIEVAAGIVMDGQGRVLLCQRQGELEGLWEFPGGKREAGESFEQCLVREVWEELRLVIRAQKELCRMPYKAREKAIVFSFWLAEAQEGQALTLLVHQDARWVAPQDIVKYALCPADAEFVRQGLAIPH